MQRYIITQKDAANELGIIAGWLNGYVERQQHAHRLVVNYTKLGVVINYFSRFPLRSIKAASFFAWLEVGVSYLWWNSANI